MTETRSAWGYGLATQTDAGAVLDTWYPAPQLGEAAAETAPASVCVARPYPHADRVSVMSPAYAAAGRTPGATPGRLGTLGR